MKIKSKVIEQANGRARVTTKASVLSYCVIVLLFSLDLSVLIWTMVGRTGWSLNSLLSSGPLWTIAFPFI